jgi:hypothetical protein
MWWAYWQLQLLQHIQKHHAHFDRTVLWRRERSFFINMGSIYLFALSKNTLTNMLPTSKRSCDQP